MRMFLLKTGTQKAQQAGKSPRINAIVYGMKNSISRNQKKEKTAQMYPQKRPQKRAFKGGFLAITRYNGIMENQAQNEQLRGGNEAAYEIADIIIIAISSSIFFLLTSQASFF